MTLMRQRDDRFVEARTRRRIVAGVVLGAVAVLALFVTRTLRESMDQMRAALQLVVSAPHATAQAQREPVRATASTAALEPEAPAPSPPPQRPATLESETEAAEGLAQANAGPPSGAEFLTLVESGLLPEVDLEAAAELRRALDEEATP
jgi:hypothetical protein